MYSKFEKFHKAVNEKNHFKVSYGLEEIVLRQIKICNIWFFLDRFRL